MRSCEILRRGKFEFLDFENIYLFFLKKSVDKRKLKHYNSFCSLCGSAGIGRQARLRI